MMNFDRLINKFINTAILHGEASNEGKYIIAYRQYKVVVNIVNKLKNDSMVGLSPLIPLLKHPNDYVKLAAAAYTFSIATQKAEKVLIELSEKPKTLGLNATIILREWKNGNMH